MSGATICVRLRKNASVRLATSVNSDLSSCSYSAAQTTVNRMAKFAVSGLAANTQYYYGVEVDGVLNTATIGKFKTLGATTLKVCLAGDATGGSTADVFNDIVAEAPHLFFHLGDAHYDNIAVSDRGRFDASYDAMLGSSTQGPLYRQVPTVYVWDDHDFGDNNSFGTSPSKAEATRAYRRRVPHAALSDGSATGAIYHSFEVTIDGLGVIFIITDQRSAASNKSATDNSSKTVLGATQKTWFKNILSGNSGKLFVWICSRTWGGVTAAGADHWGGFTTERTEIANYIRDNCPGRVLVVSADMHSLAVDSGTNHNFVSSGSEPIPTYQCAPLDRTGNETYGGATYSQGQFTNNGQFGIMEFSKTGASQITVDFTGKRDTGSTLVTYSRAFNL